MSYVHSQPPYIDDDKKSSIDFAPPPLPNDQHAAARPPIDYSSFGAFCQSTWDRFKSLWTRQFILSLLAGQVVSLCITCTNVTTEELALGGWQLPTTQTFFLCQAPLFSLMHEFSSRVLQIPFHLLRLYTVHDPPLYALPLSIKTVSYIHCVYRWPQRLAKTDLQRWVEVYVLMIFRFHWCEWLTFQYRLHLGRM